MPDSFVIKDQFGIYFLTFQVVAWVDIFTRKRYKDVVVDAFNYCVSNKGLRVHGWCIMSNHVHCILSSADGKLSDRVRDFKPHTSKQIIDCVQKDAGCRREWMLFQFKHPAQQHVRNTNYQLWTHENHAIGIDGHIFDMYSAKLNYINNNPVKEGWVQNAKEYFYSIARDYEKIKGLVQIHIL